MASLDALEHLPLKLVKKVILHAKVKKYFEPAGNIPGGWFKGRVEEVARDLLDGKKKYKGTLFLVL